MNVPQKLELSRPLAVDKVATAGMEDTITATAEERAALAKRFDLLDLPRLEAKLAIRHAKLHGHFDVTGSLSADVVQSCVITLEPLPATVEQQIELRYAPVAPGSDLPENEEDEPIVHGMIDLGETVAQCLGLGLDPYPRKPGLEFNAQEFGESGDQPANPFAQLVEFKKPQK